MSTQFQSNNPTSYFGILPTNPGNNFFHDRDPNNALDIHNYRPGDRWINKIAGTIWGLIDIVNQASPLPPVARWVLLGSLSAPEIETITGDDSVVVVPTSGNVYLLGDSTSGVQTSGSGSTETISLTTVPIAHGGTNATSFATTNGVVTYDGTSLIANDATIDALGNYTNVKQTYFSATASTQAAVTGDGTTYTIEFTTVGTNVGSGFDGTSTFTAPVAGTYLFTYVVALNNLDSTQTTMDFTINSTLLQSTDPYSCSKDSTYYRFNGAYIMSMTMGATAALKVMVSGGTKTVAVYNGTFQGILLS